MMDLLGGASVERSVRLQKLEKYFSVRIKIVFQLVFLKKFTFDTSLIFSPVWIKIKQCQEKDVVTSHIQ